MQSGVYPLYPKAKRFLRVLMGIYGLVVLLCVPVLFGSATVAGKIVVGMVGLIALIGLVLSIHLTVIGVPPPEGMTPLVRKPRKNENWLRLRFGNSQLYLVGEEARPMQALMPLLLLLFLTCCCAPCTGIVIAVTS